jgi:[ribosomal protein S18]-alanine N-acetyltransferase
VLEIERQSFSAPWSARAYEYELRYNDLAHYFVARLQPIATMRAGPRNWLESLLRPAPPPTEAVIVGYVGFWLMAGEAHISTIAVAPRYRGRSIGELMLVAGLERAIEMNAHEATLEVRVSNLNAQELYLKYGFVKVGMRKGYYTDNNEDALIMTTPPFSSAEYQQRFQRLREALLLRLRATPTLKESRARTRMRGGTTYGG